MKSSYSLAAVTISCRSTRCRVELDLALSRLDERVVLDFMDELFT